MEQTEFTRDFSVMRLTGSMLVLFFICLSLNAPVIADQGDGVFRIGVSSSGLTDVNHNDAAAALKAWASTVAMEQGLDELLEVTLLPATVGELRTSLKENQLSGISVSTQELMELDLQIDTVYIPIRNESPETKYALIVHGESQISNPKDLNNRKIIMENTSRMALALPWLKTILGNPEWAFKLPATVDNPSMAILQVFFQQSDAALVVLDTFDMACELNPQMRNKLMILQESPPFVISFFVFPPAISNKQNTDKLEKTLMDLHTTPGGRQMLTVFKSSRIEKFPESILDRTIQFLQGPQHSAKEVAAVETVQ